MKASKKIGIILGIIAVIAAAAGIYLYMTNWPLRFHGELDDFFGKGNWHVADRETRDSMIYSENMAYTDAAGLYHSQPGKFHSWYIVYEKEDSTEGAWCFTDHALKISRHKSLFHCLSAKEAMTLELMDLFSDRAGDEICREVLSPILSPEEMECLRVDISYRDGNPSGSVLKQLRKQPWFSRGDAKSCLSWDGYDFYLNILAYDYKADKLPEELKTHLQSSLPRMEAALQDYLGEACDYRINLGKDADGNPCRAEYGN